MRLLAVVALIAGLLAPVSALAAPRQFRIPAKPLSEALVDFAVQADISINTGPVRVCRRLSNPVAGRMEAEEALRRLLAGTGCGYRMIDSRTVRIVILPIERLLPQLRPAKEPPTPPDTPSVVDDLVVTATRRPSVASRLPYSVGVLPASRLSQFGVEGADGVALMTPGLTVTNLGAGRDKLIIRGLSDGAMTGRIQATVGVYLDDVRLTYNAPDPDLLLSDVDRVEILRGPQGSLYGSGSVGGVYRIITRRPELGVFDAAAAAEGAVTLDGEPSYLMQAMINLPLLDDRVALRLVGYAEHNGGYIDDVGLGRDNVNTADRTGVRATLRWAAAPNVTLLAGVLRQTIDAEDTQYTHLGLPGLTRANRVPEPYENDFFATWATVTGDSRWGQLRWSSAWQEHKLTSVYDASGVLPAFGAPPGPAAAYDEDLSTRTLVTELTLLSPVGARVPWLLGAFYSWRDEDVQTELENGLRVYHEDRADELEEAALYGEVSYPFGRRWTVTAGGRLFWSSATVESEIDTPFLGSASFDNRVEEYGFAPKLVVRYQATENLMFYVQGAEGYRAGGYNTSGPIGQPFNAPGGGMQPFRRYGGDGLRSIEAGGKFSAPALGVSVQAAAFHVDWRDIQSTQLLPSGVPYTANIGDGANVGLELEASWLSGPFELTANLLVNEAELERGKSTFPVLPESPLAGVPQVSGGLSASYERPLAGGLIFSADALAAYVGPSEITFDSSIARQRMGGYVYARLGVALERGRWRADAFVENLANDDGDTFAFGNPFTLPTAPQETPQRPLTAGVRLNWRF